MEVIDKAISCIESSGLATQIVGGCVVAFLSVIAGWFFIGNRRRKQTGGSVARVKVKHGTAINESDLTYQNVGNINYGTQSIGEASGGKDQEHLRHVIHALKEQKENWPKRKGAHNWEPTATSWKSLQEHVPSLGSTIP